MVRLSIPMLYSCRTELGVPFSQSQKHKSSIHDWKKWWRGSVMPILTSLGTIACSLGHQNKCPHRILLGQVRKSHTDTCPQTVEGGTVTVETLPGAPGTLMFLLMRENTQLPPLTWASPQAAVREVSSAVRQSPSLLSVTCQPSVIQHRLALVGHQQHSLPFTCSEGDDRRK